MSGEGRKRKQARWKVVVATSVVLLLMLCAAALLYRPVPYEFLRGSDYLGADIVDLGRLFGFTPSLWTNRHYYVRGTWEEVLRRAESELTRDAGWHTQGMPSQFTNTSNKAHIQIVDLSGMGQRTLVLVRVQMPTKPLDHIEARIFPLRN